MKIDAQFAEWWTQCLGNPPIPEGYVRPVLHALQGHPEAPRLWETHIHAILVEKLDFVPTTHEKCLYSKRDSTGTLQLLLRQVDDFSVAAKDREIKYYSQCLRLQIRAVKIDELACKNIGLSNCELMNLLNK
jgi:hypothetical protein